MKLLYNRFKNLTGIQLTLLIVGILWLKTVIVSFIGFNLSIQSLFDVALILTSSIGALLLVMGISFYFGGKVKPAILFALSVAGTGVLYGDLLYYRFYNDFVTAPILFQFDNVGGLSASTVELMSFWDILLFVDLFVLGWFLMKQRFELTIQKETRKKYVAVGAAFLVLTIGLGLVKSVHLFSESYDREQVVKSLGPLNYHVYDLAVGISAPLQRLTMTEAEAVASIESLQQKEPGRTDLYGMAEGKNIVLISLESTQDFVINQKVNGEEVTPFLNELIEESFYFDQVYDQTAQGKTSDAEFMIDTSLYPLASGSVFVRRPENTFYSLPHILKEQEDYYAATFHGNVDTFWNRNVMYESLGYDRYFSKEDYDVTEGNSVNYGLKDIPFFIQSAAYMKNLPEPYYAKFLTLTNHFPFLLEEEDMLIDPAATDEDVVNRYVTTVRYLDKSLETFFEQLKEEGLYEDTVFVLVGDHYGISEKYEAGLNQLLGEEATITTQMQHKQVPLIIHIPGQQGETISTQGGEIDIRPTLLHLMGIKTENRYSFGHNLFTRDSDHPVIFRDGSFISDDYIYKDNVCYAKENGAAIDEQSCEPYLETVREELKLSDKIIFGDLLRYMVGEE
ncbi:LTA synthase family protein [Planomicrobium okeanokoites]|uniref:LTA synthase family protein n=1 Tax=Planomicrobium okeanokoites TaxID=244 RepID=UPI0030F4C5B3